MDIDHDRRGIDRIDFYRCLSGWINTPQSTAIDIIDIDRKSTDTFRETSQNVSNKIDLIVIFAVIDKNRSDR
jgi:hypothetical protein